VPLKKGRFSSETDQANVKYFIFGASLPIKHFFQFAITGIFDNIKYQRAGPILAI
jgi:hypothetical protein